MNIEPRFGLGTIRLSTSSCLTEEQVRRAARLIVDAALELMAEADKSPNEPEQP